MTSVVKGSRLEIGATPICLTRGLMTVYGDQEVGCRFLTLLVDGCSLYRWVNRKDSVEGIRGERIKDTVIANLFLCRLS